MSIAQKESEIEKMKLEEVSTFHECRKAVQHMKKKFPGQAYL